MPIPLWAFPATSVSMGSAFALADLLTQRIVIRNMYRKRQAQIRTFIAKGGELDMHTHVHAPENVAEMGDTGGVNTTAEEHAKRAKLHTLTVKYSLQRTLFFGALGMIAGGVLPSVADAVGNIIPGVSAGALIGKSVLIELLFVPPVVAGVLGASAFFHHGGDAEAVKTKLVHDFPVTLVPQLLVAASWALVFSPTGLMMPGFTFGIPGSICAMVLHTPYLMLLSYRSFRGEDMPLEFSMLPFSLADVFSQQSALCVAWVLGCGYLNCLGQVFTDYVGTNGTLWDPGFILLPYVPAVWAIDAFVAISLLTMFSHAFFNSSPTFPVVVRRFLLIHGATLLVRTVTLFATGAFLPNPEFTCVTDHPQPFLISSALVLFGAGHTCHDLMFSGHSSCLMVPALYMQHHSKSTALKVAAWGFAGVGMATVVATHAHYTIDVLCAILVSTTVWHGYHGLATMDVQQLTDAPEQDVSAVNRRMAAVAKLVQWVEHSRETDPEMEPATDEPTPAATS